MTRAASDSPAAYRLVDAVRRHGPLAVALLLALARTLAAPLAPGGDGGAASALAWDAPLSLGAARPLGGLLAQAALAFPVGDAASRLDLGAVLVGMVAALLVLGAAARLGGASSGPARDPGDLAAAVLVLCAATPSLLVGAAAAGLALLCLLVPVPLPGVEPRPSRGALPALLCLALLSGLGATVMAPLLLPLVGGALLSLRRGARWPLWAPTALALGLPILLGSLIPGHAHGVGVARASLWWEAIWPDGALVRPTAASLWAAVSLLEAHLGLPALFLALAGLAGVLRRRGYVAGSLLALSASAPAWALSIDPPRPPGPAPDAAALGLALASICVLAGAGISMVARQVVGLGATPGRGAPTTPESRHRRQTGARFVALGLSLVVVSAALLQPPAAPPARGAATAGDR